jgi:hypothetical protein
VMGVREDSTSRGGKHFHRLVPIYISDGGGVVMSKRKYCSSYVIMYSKTNVRTLVSKKYLYCIYVIM